MTIFILSMQNRVFTYQNKHFSGYISSENSIFSVCSPYELSNHLGNVLSVISDKPIPVESTSATGVVQYYKAEILSSQDYSPFGVTLRGRKFNKQGAEDFRFGFNGMEADDEVKGSGNSYTTQFRQYDPRLGRWLTIDPMYEEFPWQSPYVAYDNNPIFYVDPKGLSAQGNGDKLKQNSDGTRSKNNNDGTETFDAPGFTTVILPDRAKILGTMQDSDGNGKIDYNGVQLQASKGDLYQFSVDNVVYTAKFSKGKFTGFYSSKGVPYVNAKGKIPTKPISTTPQNGAQNINQPDEQESDSGPSLSPLGPALYLSGQPIKYLKPVGALGSKPGSSVASYTLSKTFPQKFTKTLGKKVGTKVATTVGTNVIGRAAGRLVPVVGTALILWDVAEFMYDNREAFKYGMSERQRLIEEGYMPIR